MSSTEEKPVGKKEMKKEESLKAKFDLSDKVVVITDGLDKKAHSFIESIIMAKGIPVILGNNQEKLDGVIKNIKEKKGLQ